jgi:hypothetical protein
VTASREWQPEAIAAPTSSCVTAMQQHTYMLQIR